GCRHVAVAVRRYAAGLDTGVAGDLRAVAGRRLAARPNPSLELDAGGPGGLAVGAAARLARPDMGTAAAGASVRTATLDTGAGRVAGDGAGCRSGPGGRGGNRAASHALRYRTALGRIRQW